MKIETAAQKRLREALDKRKTVKTKKIVMGSSHSIRKLQGDKMKVDNTFTTKVDNEKKKT